MNTRIETVQISRHILAQGEVVSSSADGRVTINAGGKLVTGFPVPIIKNN